MAIDKDFVVKNGLQVNDDLIYADPSTENVGLGTTQADKKLVVIGDSEVSQSLTIGSGLSVTDGNFTGIITSNGLDVGVGGTLLSVDTIQKKVGVNSTSPEYTVDIRGPVSTGTNAAYIFGDVEVTGSVTAANFTGQVQGGGDITLNNLTINDDLVGNNANVYTFFKVNLDGDKFRFVNRDTPPITNGFPSSRNNPTIYLTRGQHYQFELNTSGSPFYIKTSPSVDTSNQYNDGVVNNGVQTGICTFKVPYNAPNILYYQSSLFSGGGGKIILNSDGLTQTSENLNVTGTIDSQGQATFNNIDVTGIATINDLKGPNNFSVSAGVVTAVKFSGVSTGTDNININTTSSNEPYQIVFTETNESGYKKLYIDDQGPQLTYDAQTNKLTVGSLKIRGQDAIEGVSTGANNVKVNTINANRKFEIPFYEVSSTNPSYRGAFVDSVSETFSYNPVDNKLFVPNIEATTVTASLTGVSTGAQNINIISDTSFTDNNKARILLAADNDPDTTRYDNVLITNTLKYNRGKGILFAGGFNGVGSTITNLNANNIDRGEVGVEYLPNASTSTVGVTSLSDSTTSNLSTVAATSKAVKTAFDKANDLIPAGSKMLFCQSTAPTGWTKLTQINEQNIDDSALRIVGGATGGSFVFTDRLNFTGVFNSKTVPLPQHNHGVSNDSHSHSITDPGHNHEYPKRFKIDANTVGDGTSDNQILEDTTTDNLPTTNTASTGITGTNAASTGITINNAGQANASLNFSVKYVDIIICSKD